MYRQLAGVLRRYGEIAVRHIFLNNEVVQVLKGQKLHVATSEVDPNVIGYVSFVMARGHMMIVGNFVRKCM